MSATADAETGFGTLAAILAERDLQGQAPLALRLSLNRRDRSSDFRTTADLVSEGVAGLYARLQDGRRFGDEAKVLVFIAEADGVARLAGVQHLVAWRKGLVPSDIVHDYDAAHLLHGFIARARCPVFHDAFEEPGWTI